MDKRKLQWERARLQGLLSSYESGHQTHQDEDERGELTRDVTDERIADLRARIAEIDRKLTEDWRA